MGNIPSNAQYDLIEINTPYVVPPNPGPLLVIAIGLEDFQSRTLVRAHKKSLRERKDWLNIEREVKNQMQKAFLPGDISGMRDLYCRFQNTLARDLLARAITQCLIGPFMISENKERLTEAWEASTPFTDLVEHTFEVQEFVSDAGRPIDDREIMTEVYTIIYQMGILTEDFEKWDERPNVGKTCANFEKNFTDAQQKMRKR